MGGPIKGRADYLELGDYNASCSMCGRKRKASTLVRNWQGLYRCPEHDEPRQTQDYVRGTKDVITIPWGQPQITTYVTVNATFPAAVAPTSLFLAKYLTTESGLNLITESGVFLVVLQSLSAEVVLQNWITVQTFAWSWQSGGTGITIQNPTTAVATFIPSAASLSGVAQCLITNNVGAQATVTVSVSS